MAYSNDQTQIKAGLTNYVGSLLKSSPYDVNGAKQNVNSILLEQILSISSNEDKSYNYYSLKPLYRATINTLVSKCKELQLDAKNNIEQLENYKLVIIILKDLVDSL